MELHDDDNCNKLFSDGFILWYAHYGYN